MQIVMWYVTKILLFLFLNSSADEEAGEVGPNEDDEDNAGDNQQGTTGEVKVETSHRQSLTRRISNLYGSLISKAAPKKSDRSGSSGASAGIGNAAADVDAKVSEGKQNPQKNGDRDVIIRQILILILIFLFIYSSPLGRSDRVRRIGFEITAGRGRRHHRLCGRSDDQGRDDRIRRNPAR